MPGTLVPAVTGPSVMSPDACEDGVVDVVRVLSTSSVPEGEIAKARLEDEGIPVLVKGEGEGPYRIGPVHLFVPAELEVQARLILNSTFSDVGEDWDPAAETLGDATDEAEEPEPS